MSNSPDDLIQRLSQNERTGFEDVISWYSQDILRLCFLLLRNQEDAEDALQETMIRFVRSVRRGKVRGQNGSIKAYLLQIARNLCIDKLRKKKVDFRSLDDSPDEMAVSNGFTPDQAAEESTFYTAFERALGRLSAAQRSVLVLRELKDESYQEIADGLNVSVECVKKQLYRARRKMRLLLRAYQGEI